MSKWTNQMEEQACREGWSVFDTGDGVEIERIDCPSDQDSWTEGMSEEPIFADDDKALEFVIQKAKSGSELHIIALEMHCLSLAPSPFILGRAEEYQPHIFDDVHEQRIKDEALGEAAQDLRDALEKMLEKFENDVLPGEAGWDAVEAARAALKKARGD